MYRTKKGMDTPRPMWHVVQHLLCAVCNMLQKTNIIYSNVPMCYISGWTARPIRDQVRQKGRR